MNIFAKLVHLPELSGPKVAYYTVKISQGDDNWRIPETNDFFERHENEISYAVSLDELFLWLEQMAQKDGAKDHFFRDEAKAQALPPENRQRQSTAKRLKVVLQESNKL